MALHCGLTRAAGFAFVRGFQRGSLEELLGNLRVAEASHERARRVAEERARVQAELFADLVAEERARVRFEQMQWQARPAHTHHSCAGSNTCQ